MARIRKRKVRPLGLMSRFRRRAGGYDDLGVREINSRLPSLSEVDLSTVEAYERKHKKRKTVLQKIDSVRDARD